VIFINPPPKKRKESQLNTQNTIKALNIAQLDYHKFDVSSLTNHLKE